MATPWAGATLGAGGPLAGWAWNANRTAVVAPSHVWWDGAAYHAATLVGWWDGVTTHSVVLLGEWDGTTVQPVGAPH